MGNKSCSDGSCSACSGCYEAMREEFNIAADERSVIAKALFKMQEVAKDLTAQVSNLQLNLGKAITEREDMLAQLPDGMNHCTILFKECRFGHGWLTATNWVQHGCPTCELEDIKHHIKQAINQFTTMPGSAIAHLRSALGEP